MSDFRAGLALGKVCNLLTSLPAQVIHCDLVAYYVGKIYKSLNCLSNIFLAVLGL